MKTILAIGVVLAFALPANAKECGVGAGSSATFHANGNYTFKHAAGGTSKGKVVNHNKDSYTIRFNRSGNVKTFNITSGPDGSRYVEGRNWGC